MVYCMREKVAMDDKRFFGEKKKINWWGGEWEQTSKFLRSQVWLYDFVSTPTGPDCAYTDGAQSQNDSAEQIMGKHCAQHSYEPELDFLCQFSDSATCLICMLICEHREKYN